MNLTLPADIQRLIDERVKSGRYQSAEEVVTVALANLDQQDHLRDLSADELRAIYPDMSKQIAHGYSQAQAGKLSDGDAFFAELEQEENGTN